jgi:ADP-ribosylglycohydrolase
MLNPEKYLDKVLGAWVGKSAGGILGAPIEGYKRFNDIALSEELFKVNYPNDDLDLQVVWLDLLQKKGINTSPADFAEHWLKHVDFPWNEYGIATRNLKLGLIPPQSGYENNYYWHQSMGCPIRSELWGLLFPARPEIAAHFARIDASLDHYGFSVDAEIFLSCCTSLAFEHTDISTIFTKALVCIEPNCEMAQMVKTIMNWCEKHDALTVRGKIKSKYGDADFTSAPMNVAFSLLALLKDGNDFDCIMKALHYGHDSDCISATVGALIGVILGYEAIDEKWKTLVGNSLVISKEIVGLNLPTTLDELAQQTVNVGMSFEGEKSDLKNEVVEFKNQLNYGNWLLLGPFITDDEAKTPMDETHPDHGIGVMPSVNYMNHDKVNFEKQFLSLEEIKNISEKGNLDDHDFLVQIIEPQDFRINFEQYYKGRGERTLYLYSNLNLDFEGKIWISFGTESYFHFWWNGELIDKKSEVKRSWIGANYYLVDVKKGLNAICFKLDLVIDSSKFEIGFKEYKGHHPHQSQWLVEVPKVEFGRLS